MKRIVVLLVVVILVIGAIVFISSRTFVKFTYTNIDSVEVSEVKSGNIAGRVSNNDSLYLVKDTEYKASYKGASGYADGSVTFNSSDASPVSIKPYYSSERLLEILSSESNSIHQKLYSSFPDLPRIFNLSKEGMLQYGDWYVALYKHKGAYGLYSDSLRVIAKKSGNKWRPATSPEIFINRVDYPKIPTDIIKKANAL